MKGAGLARRSARRAALLGMGAAYRGRGQSRTALNAPGLTVLLIHYTPPRALDRLLTYIDRHREQFVGFDEGLELVAEGVTRPLIALSFDDGFRSNLMAAAALTDRGLGAVFYVPTDVIGSDRADVDRFFRRSQPEGVMTWTDLEWLRDSGHTVGSHCRQHKPLSDLSRPEAEDQIKGSVQVLRDRLGAAEHFAWPFGSLAHAPVTDVLRWCDDVGVLAASGVRGRNTPDLMSRRGYLSRDAVDLNWLATDIEVFTTRTHRRVNS